MAGQRPMRKKEREIRDPAEISRIIEAMDSIRIGFFDGEEVYIVPLSFGYEEKDGRYTFYMHDAKTGRKADLARQCAKAGFEMDKTILLHTDPNPCDHTVEYKSVIGHGSIEEVTDEAEKIKGLNCIMKQNTGKGEWSFPEAMLKATLVIRLTSDWITCKVHE